MTILSKRHIFHGMLLAYLLAYSFRLTPDQWTHAESFSPQNKVQTEYIESESPVYAYYSSPEENRFAIGRDNRESSSFEIPECFIGLPIKACHSGHILTSADRIISFLHRATPLAGSSDDDLLS